MAGYVTKLMGHVYDGENLSAETLTNGVFAEITTDGVKKVTAAKDTKLRVDEKTELWGQPAVVNWRMRSSKPSGIWHRWTPHLSGMNC